MRAKFLGQNRWGGLTTGEVYMIDTHNEKQSEDGRFWIHLMGRKLTYPYSSKETFLKDWEPVKK